MSLANAFANPPVVKQTLLSPRGVFYMVVVIENRPKEIADILARDGFNMTVRRGSYCSERIRRIANGEFTAGGALDQGAERAALDPQV